MKLHISRLYAIGFFVGTLTTYIGISIGICLSFMLTILFGFLVIIIGKNTKRYK